MPGALTLAEEIVLLSLDDETGRPVGRAGMAPDLALAGALLMELALAGKVDTDRDRLFVVETTPTGDAVRDGIDAIEDTPSTNSSAGWPAASIARRMPAMSDFTPVAVSLWVARITLI